MLQAEQQGKTRFIGITNYRLGVARETIESGLYDTLQFPWGIQQERELDEFLSYIPKPPVLDDSMKTCIEADRKELQGDFAGAVATACRVCRGFASVCAPGRRCCFGGHPWR